MRQRNLFYLFIIKIVKKKLCLKKNMFFFSAFRKWVSPRELWEYEQSLIPLRIQKDLDEWEITLRKYSPDAEYFQWNIVKTYDICFFLNSPSKIIVGFFDIKFGFLTFGPCFFKFIFRDFIKKKCNIRINTRILSFLNLNFIFSKISFFTILCIIGVAIRRLEGEDFARSPKEAHRWRSALWKLAVERWYL